MISFEALIDMLCCK